MCCPHQIIDAVYSFILVWLLSMSTTSIPNLWGWCVCVHSHSQCQYIKPELIRIDRLVKRNLNEFIEILQSDRPLFCVDAVLSTPHISLQPTGVEVCNTIMQVVNGFLERYGTHKRFEFLALCCQRDEVEWQQRQQPNCVVYFNSTLYLNVEMGFNHFCVRCTNAHIGASTSTQ